MTRLHHSKSHHDMPHHNLHPSTEDEIHKLRPTQSVSDLTTSNKQRHGWTIESSSHSTNVIHTQIPPIPSSPPLQPPSHNDHHIPQQYNVKPRRMSIEQGLNQLPD